MKLQKLLVIGFLLVISVAVATAQNTLPNPNDDSCWSSLDALRACQLRAYNAAQDYERRCSSYPEYQCVPVEQQQTWENATVRQDKNQDTQTNNARRPLGRLTDFGVPGDGADRDGSSGFDCRATTDAEPRDRAGGGDVGRSDCDVANSLGRALTLPPKGRG